MRHLSVVAKIGRVFNHQQFGKRYTLCEVKIQNVYIVNSANGSKLRGLVHVAWLNLTYTKAGEELASGSIHPRKIIDAHVKNMRRKNDKRS